jgi:hypothetical protein
MTKREFLQLLIICSSNLLAGAGGNAAHKKECDLLRALVESLIKTLVG